MKQMPVKAAEKAVARRRANYTAPDASDAPEGVQREIAVSARSVLDGVTTEKQWQDVVVRCAKANRWLVYHTFDARRSEPGFPDLCCVHPERGWLLFLECKREKGRVRPEQQVWIDAINRLGLTDVVARVVRPSDWQWVHDMLTCDW